MASRTFDCWASPSPAAQLWHASCAVSAIQATIPLACAHLPPLSRSSPLMNPGVRLNEQRRIP